MNNFKCNTLSENGYVILKSVFESEFLDKICSIIDEDITHAEKILEDPFSSHSIRDRPDNGVLYDLLQRHLPDFLPFITNNDILSHLDTVLGSDYYLYDNSMIYKSKYNRNEVPWHQDFISRPSEPLKYIVWVALDKVTIANGALKIIPKSHKLGHQKWHRVNGETHHDRINEDIIEKHIHNKIYVEMERGDVLIFNMKLFHGSDEVNINDPRRAFRFSCQSLEKQIYTPRQSPIVLRGGRASFFERNYTNKFVPIKKTFIQKIKSNIIRILSK